jgi:hypothetical protein
MALMVGSNNGDGDGDGDGEKVSSGRAVDQPSKLGNMK